MSWWHYLLLVNIYLVLFYSFYTLLLRRETFFQLNRVYLVGTAVLSFFIPLIQSTWVKGLFITQQVQNTIYGGSLVAIVQITPVKDNAVTIGQLMMWLYVAGVVLLTGKLVVQLSALKKIIAQPAANAAYSFFNKVRIGDTLPDKAIIESHEQAHVRQFHSADVLLIEAVMIINWFNPVVYLYRFAIKHIHEFIADSQALKEGADKKAYALLLLSQTFNAPTHQLLNPFFNHSLLKQRIMMLQKNKSQRIKLIKYGLSAPLFVLMLILSSATVSNSKAIKTIHRTAELVLESPAAGVAEKPLTKSPGLSNIGQAIAIDTVPAVKSTVYTKVQQSPSFKGGIEAFAKYLGSNIKYPEEARDKNIQGRSVITFIVEKDGSLSDLKVARALGGGTDEEAIRVLAASPKWIPGMQNGKPVRVQYTVPVQFSLDNKEAALTSSPGEPAFTAVEHAPSFPGGMDKFGEFLGHNIKYPADARKANIQGRVIVTFIVEKDGSLSNLKVVKGVATSMDEEAVRVLKLSPKWNPGMQNNQLVRVQYAVPIQFSLAYNKPKQNKIGVTTTQSGAVFINADTSKAITIYKTANISPAPMYIIDGEVVKSPEFAKLSPDKIQSIAVYKDDSTLKSIYGEAADNGVVVIKTKKQ